MKKDIKSNTYLKVIFVISLSLLLGISNNFAQSDDDLTELEEFIAEETISGESATLLPTEREVSSVFGTSKSLLDIPRSVTVINPESLREFDLQSVYDLAEIVPGATVVNYYGVPGIPTTRGLFTSIYFNGMQRVWNRNGYPTSFGSLESIDFVKGPPPGTYSAASPGGYVNFVPKSPYFDKFRGSVKLTVGSYSHFNTQIDLGGPGILGGKPMAWRISITNQDSDTYHDSIADDYVSIYASMKLKLSDRVSMFFGGEYYQHRSNENVGWNRVTQDLIDNGIYIIGNPLNDITGEIIEMPSPFGPFTQTVVNRTPGQASREALESTAPFGGIKGNFGRTTTLIPSALSDDALAFYAFVGGLNNSGNPFAPNFNGTIQTAKIAGNINNNSPEDFADADVFLFFWDTIFKRSDNFSITNKFMIDTYSREKVSKYGYGEDGENFTMENKILVEHKLPNAGSGSTLVYGASVRFEDAYATTDFSAEPFSRRDITQPIVPNTNVPAGGQVNLDGQTFWDPYGSNETKMITYGIFLTADMALGEKFNLIASGRFDHANWWDRKRPGNITSNPFSPQPGDIIGGGDGGGGTSYHNWSVNGIYRVANGVSVYAMYQDGTSFQGYYVSGGIHRGDTNFQQSSLAEAGVKFSVADNTLYSTISIFHIDLTNFDDRAAAAFRQRGRGIETELVYEPNDWFSLSANFTWSEHFYRGDLLPGGFVPLTPEEMVIFAGSAYLDFGRQVWRGKAAGVGDGPRQGLPEWNGSVYVRFKMPNGISFGIGPRFSDSVYLNPDKTLLLPSFTTWNGRVAYSAEKWTVAFSASNLFNEDYFYPADPFASNAIITKEPTVQWRATFTYRF